MRESGVWGSEVGFGKRSGKKDGRGEVVGRGWLDNCLRWLGPRMCLAYWTPLVWCFYSGGRVEREETCSCQVVPLAMVARMKACERSEEARER